MRKRNLYLLTASLSMVLLSIQVLQAQNLPSQNNTVTGVQALQFNTTGTNNTATGYRALRFNTTGGNNSAHGGQALLSNTTGGQNTASGASALLTNTTGSFNTASGFGALSGNTTGSQNTATGFRALVFNETGDFNTASGSEALRSNNTGLYNTTSGAYAMYSNTTGSYNNAHGAAALHDNTTGEYNTASGFGALRHSKTGLLNTSIGFLSGGFTNSSNSTFLGTYATASGNFTNATAIGHEATATASNQVRIGNASVTSIGGQVSWTNFSDGRYKKNLKEDVPGLSFITKLRPLTYTLDVEGIDKSIRAAMPGETGSGELASAAAKQKAATGEAKARGEKARIKYTGFVAQEVEAAAKELGYDFSGVDAPKDKEGFYGLRYAEFVVPLIKAVQEQQEQIEKQEKKITVQQQQINELKDMVTKLLNSRSVTANNSNNTNVSITGAYLEQSVPNPNRGSTLIRYHLPQSTGDARIVITNMKGQLLKSIALSNKGAAQVTLDGSTLAAGNYTYSLWVEGRQVDTKQMQIIK